MFWFWVLVVLALFTRSRFLGFWVGFAVLLRFFSGSPVILTLGTLVLAVWLMSTRTRR